MGQFTSKQQTPKNNLTPGTAEWYREEANILYQQRNNAFAQSKAAYSRKNHDDAKKLSKQGKELDAKAKEMEKKASDLIYAEKNAGRGPGEVDLHGLKVRACTCSVIAPLSRLFSQNNLFIR